MNDRAAIVLSATKVSRTFHGGPQAVEVLDGLDLQIKIGERVAILGASGSGKSTLLHCLGGLDHIDSGEIHVDGQAIHHLSEGAKATLRNKKLGFIYQLHHLLPELTAQENVAMPLMLAGKGKKAAQDRASEILGRVGLAKRLEHRPAELSGGERQRTAIARALANHPACILADEPTGNLDPHTAEKVNELLLEVSEQDQTAILMVTHDHQLAARADRILELVDGRLHPKELTQSDST